MKLIGAKARTFFFYKKESYKLPYWKLDYIYKCLSTEYELTNFLKNKEDILKFPYAIISKEQISGFGQNNRKWISPPGGIWISAAYPIFSENFSLDLYPLAIAFKLCEMLSNEFIKVNLKYPNDILFGSKKLIGFLPKIVSRGNQITYARIGIGMNVNNKVPIEGISLSKILNKKLLEEFWISKILKAISQAIDATNKKEYIIRGANSYLNKELLPKKYNNSDWKIKDIDSEGKLRIFKGDCYKSLLFSEY